MRIINGVAAAEIAVRVGASVEEVVAGAGDEGIAPHVAVAEVGLAAANCVVSNAKVVEENGIKRGGAGVDGSEETCQREMITRHPGQEIIGRIEYRNNRNVTAGSGEMAAAIQREARRIGRQRENQTRRRISEDIMR